MLHIQDKDRKFPILFLVGIGVLLFLGFLSGKEVLAGTLQNLEITFVSDKAGEWTEHTVSFQTVGSADTVVIDYSAFGTTDNDFDLSQVSLAGTSFSGFEKIPTAFSIDNTNKLITFFGDNCSIDAGATVTISSLDIRNDQNAETKDISVVTKTGGPGGTPVDSGSVPVTVTPASATKLVFTVQPSNSIAGQVIAPPIEIAVQDQYSNTVISDNSTTITVAIGSNPAEGSLSGTTNKVVVNGVATFNNLSIDKAGIGYTLTITSAPVLTGATSNTFNITAGAIAQIVFTTSPQTITAGNISSVMTIQTQDTYGNAQNVSLDTTINLTSTSANGKFYSDAGGTDLMTSVTINSGTNSASFYYKDTTAGTPTIIAAETPTQGWTDATQQETITAGALSYIVIENASGGTGSVVNNYTMTTDDTYTVYAIGYDVYGNYREDVSVSWSWWWGNFDTGDLTSVTGSTTTFSSDNTGTDVLRAADGFGHVDITGLLTVTAGVITKIVFTTPAQNIVAGAVSSIMTIQTQDAESNPSDVNSDTIINLATNSATGKFYSDPLGATEINSVVITAGNNSANFYYKDTTAGVPTITAAEDPAQGWTDATQQETITAGALNYIVIENASGGTGSVVNNYTMTTDDTYTVYAIGYDVYGNYREDVSVNWSWQSGDFDANDIAPDIGTTTTFSPDNTGTGVLKADDGAGHTDTTGTLTVTAGALASIKIRDAADGGGNEVITRSLTTDEVFQVWAAGYDAEGNYRGNVSVTWSWQSGDFDANDIAPDIGTTTTFSPDNTGTGVLKADDGAGHTDTTGTLTVTAGALASIKIRDAADGGGSEVTTYSLTTDDIFQVWAAGYDVEGNYRGNVSVTWSWQSGDFDANDIAPDIGTTTTFSPDNTGTGVLKADDGAGHTDTTGTLTVTAGALASIKIRDAADGGGSEVTTYSLTTDDIFQVWAAGYDVEGNYREDVSVTWSWQSGDFDAGDLTTLTGTTTTFSPNNTGIGVLRADDGAGHEDTTGLLTVTVGLLASIKIRDAAGGGGNEVTTYSLTTDEVFQVWAAGYDAEGNYRGDVSVNWSWQLGDFDAGDLTTLTGTTTIFSPNNTGTGVLKADDGAGHTDTTGTLTVTVGLLASIKIRDAAGGGGNEVTTRSLTTDEVFQVWAAGYDAEGNYRQDVSVSWSWQSGDFDANDIAPDIGTTTTFSPDNTGVGVLKADDGSSHIDTTGTLTVTAGAITKIVFTTPAQNIIAGTVSSIMTIQTQDAESNPSDVNLATTINLTSNSATGKFYSDSGGATEINSVVITAGNNSASFYYKDTTIGTPTITAAEAPSQGWTDATQQETINPATIYKIVFIDPVSTGTTGEPIGITIQTQDRFDNPSPVTENTVINLSAIIGGGLTSPYGEFSQFADPWNKVNSITINNGEYKTSFYYKDTRAGSPVIYIIEFPPQGWIRESLPLTINPGNFVKLQILVPGEIVLPGSPAGKDLGEKPDDETAGVPFDVTVNAVDAYWNLVSINPTGQVILSSTDPNADLPPVQNFLNSTITFSGVRLMTPGSFTITAEYVGGGIASDISPPIKVTTGANATLLKVSSRSLAPVSVAKGQVNVTMLSLQFSHPGSAGIHDIKVNKLTFTFKDKDNRNIVPGSVISKIVINDGVDTYGNKEGAEIPNSVSTLEVPLGAPYSDLILAPVESITVYVRVDISSQASAPTFRLSLLNPESIEAVDTATDWEVVVEEVSPSSFPITSEYSYVRNPGLASSCLNYPNPFAAGRQSTNIEYTLSEDSYVTIKIYTLTGKLVRVLVNNELRRSGIVNSEPWNGRNGAGQVVRNGVYLCRVEVKPVGGGPVEVKTIKIAVVK